MLLMGCQLAWHKSRALPGIVGRDGGDNSLCLHDSAQVEVSDLDSPVLVH